MTVYSLDSRAVIKRYILEAGTGWVLQHADPIGGDVLFVAQATSVEVIAGLARKTREGRITLAVMQQLRDLIASHMATEYSVVILDETILKRAADFTDISAASL